MPLSCAGRVVIGFKRVVTLNGPPITFFLGVISPAEGLPGDGVAHVGGAGEDGRAKGDAVGGSVSHQGDAGGRVGHDAENVSAEDFTAADVPAADVQITDGSAVDVVSAVTFYEV